MRSRDPILLVEDDHIDAMTVKRAFKEIQANNPLYIANHGEAALALLDCLDPMPALILLDLNMPCMNGLELLEILKRDLRWRFIPVVILTTSHEERDRLTSFAFSAAGYIVKPLDYENFVNVLKTIYQYWRLSEVPDPLS